MYSASIGGIVSSSENPQDVIEQAFKYLRTAHYPQVIVVYDHADPESVVVHSVVVSDAGGTRLHCHRFR